MPKTSSRAITSPSGTADTMEVLAAVDLPEDRLPDIPTESPHQAPPDEHPQAASAHPQAPA